MWYENDPSIINAKNIENLDYGIIFEHRFLGPVIPSKRTVKRDFLIERKRLFGIAGIEYHSYKDGLLNDSFVKHYFGEELELKFEPWNEYDPNAIAVKLLGRKVGYVPRYQTEEVNDIMIFSKRYVATIDRSVEGNEGVVISFLQEFKDKTTLPYQTDLVLTASCAPSVYKKFIKGNVGHTVSFAYSYEKKKMAMLTDMNSTLGYIDDSFIEHQNSRTPIFGFVENSGYDEDTRTAEVELRLLMKKSVINKNYLKSYQALRKHFNQFFDAGTYKISLLDLIKVVPRKSSRSISAYEPLVKYLKEYHAITLQIEECVNELDEDLSDKKVNKQITSLVNRDESSIPTTNTNTNSSGFFSSTVNGFFPIWGITLGKTTWEQAEILGYMVNIWKDGPSRYMDVGRVTFWDHKGTGRFSYLYWIRSNNNKYFPPLWKSKGFSWDFSYNEWLNVFKKLDFNITITKQPCQRVFSGRRTLSAMFKALSSDGTLLFELSFDYGDNGYDTSSPKTLYSITVKYEGS